MVFTNSLETFAKTIRIQKQKEFWRESSKYQRFSPEIPQQSVDDLLSSAPPGTFDDAEEAPRLYTCYGKKPWVNDVKHKDQFNSTEDAIEYAISNGYQLINKFKNGKTYWFKCPKGEKTYNDIIDHIENNIIFSKGAETLESIVIKLD